MSVTATPPNYVQNFILSVTSDVETKMSKKGNPFHKFRAQISKKLEDGTWVNQTFFVTAFNELPRGLQKKDRIAVDGRISINGYADRVTGEIKTILELVADSVSTYVYDPNATYSNNNTQAALPSAPVDNSGGFDDVVPF